MTHDCCYRPRMPAGVALLLLLLALPYIVAVAIVALVVGAVRLIIRLVAR